MSIPILFTGRSEVTSNPPPLTGFINALHTYLYYICDTLKTELKRLWSMLFFSVVLLRQQCLSTGQFLSQFLNF